MATSAFAEPISVYFTDTHKNSISEGSVFIYANGTFEYVSIQNGSVSYSFAQKSKLVIDQQVTPGRDYARELLDPQDKNIYFIYPIGTLQGVIKDSLANVVPNTEVTFTCVGYPLIEPKLSTDAYGYFRADLPIGNCRIHALKEQSTGSADIIITHGGLQDIALILNVTQASTYTQKKVQVTYGWAVGIIVLLLLSIFWIGYRAVHPRKKSITKIFDKTELAPSEKTPTLKLSQRTKDLLKTVNAREKQVLDVLLAKGEQTQAQIFYGTGIPKASLSRLLPKLQSQNYIDIQDYGKTKKLTLTDWFLDEKTSDETE